MAHHQAQMAVHAAVPVRGLPGSAVDMSRDPLREAIDRRIRLGTCPPRALCVAAEGRTFADRAARKDERTKL
jgi:hypothetical protein